MEYRPRAVPTGSVEELAKFLQGELEFIARTLTEQDTVAMRVLHVAPVRPRVGMLAFADGTDWNPGSGAGPYAYIGGTWTALV